MKEIILLKTIILLSSISEVLTYHQSDYRVISEWYEFIPNVKYLQNFKYINFKYNRTFHALNASAYLKINVGNNVAFSTQAYKFSSNEYRLFPLQFDANLCVCLKEDTFGLQNVYNCGNAPRCPIVKGNYSMCNWQPDYNKFPPYMPTGRYRLDLNFTYFGDMICLAKWQLEITRDIVKFPKN
ncbi:hypothetical protein ILUMI_23817 [Ignelater luminosus]|uniref:MD-2-related lipid-recognition domain-containing protein n=1 Tax=Ignelater luminosus TaxID=2038154 RepID=A0A8K0FWS7_IGNLU|nr:hypothetical protein ILUMI_23817 [Ignelater luminosus]